jgi:peptidoglycan/LPS O-acetylase OafA/YrhL
MGIRGWVAGPRFRIWITAGFNSSGVLAPGTVAPATTTTAPSAVMPGERLQGLDGLRGLAMMMVILCHLHLLTIGWTGLSSFFVLSGFLITRILLNDRNASDSLGSYFRRFYVRRVLRVFPVYYAYLIALTGSTFLVPALARIQEELPAAFLYYYNLRMTVPHESTRMLSHLWSLSVEEQFYLAWPLLIAFSRRAWVPYVCIALVGLGPLLRLAAGHLLFPSLGASGHEIYIYTYVLTTSHLDAFALGALLNFVHWRPHGWQLAAMAAFVLTAGLLINQSFGMRTLSFGWPLFLPLGLQYVWGYTAINLFWFMVIAMILAGGRVKRFFSWSVLDYLGKRSYSTYIIHFPLLALMEPLWNKFTGTYGTITGTLLFMVPYLALVFVVSNAMYQFIEQPFNALRARFHVARATAQGQMSRVLA